MIYSHYFEFMIFVPVVPPNKLGERDPLIKRQKSSVFQSQMVEIFDIETYFGPPRPTGKPRGFWVEARLEVSPGSGADLLGKLEMEDFITRKEEKI